MRPLKYAEMPMDEAVKNEALRIIVENESTPQALCELNVRLGEMFADGIQRFPPSRATTSRQTST